jgi:hypothetical protein
MNIIKGGCMPYTILTMIASAIIVTVIIAVRGGTVGG